MIVQRYEKGMKFLDLERYQQRSVDEDGRTHIDECWACAIYENDGDMDKHAYVEFGSEVLARMFVTQNGWKEQVL
jgi:hypothetical protein